MQLAYMWGFNHAAKLHDETQFHEGQESHARSHCRKARSNHETTCHAMVWRKWFLFFFKKRKNVKHWTDSKLEKNPMNLIKCRTFNSHFHGIEPMILNNDKANVIIAENHSQEIFLLESYIQINQIVCEISGGRRKIITLTIDVHKNNFHWNGCFNLLVTNASMP